MNSKFLIVFLFLALLALVVDAQQGGNSQNTNKNDQTNIIDQCIRKYNCREDDRPCRSACAGVPSGGNKVAIATTECYTGCQKKYPEDVPAYTGCTKSCREKVYQQGITEPGSAVPKADSQSDGQTTSTDGGDKSDNSSADTNADNNTQSGNGNDKKDSGASPFSKSVLVYVFAAVLACAAFTVGL